MEPNASRLALPASASAAPAFDELWRYFLVSAVALGVDYGLLVALTEALQVPYLISGGVGFLAGAVVAYLGSVLWVFSARRVSDRGRELTLFVLIGVGGLGLNELLLWSLTEVALLHYTASKLGAAGAGFVFNFVVRKVILFR
jgi:putative flippase GtrA